MGVVSQVETAQCNRMYCAEGLLGALDVKIDQNRQAVQALERPARTIFRAWFVDLEPVKAKGAGSFPSMSQEVFGRHG